MIDFTLSPSQLATRNAARTFASTHLLTAKATYDQIPSHAQRFQSLQPLYEEAVKAGLIKGQIPAPIGGTSNGLIEATILVEEMSAVERAASLTIFGTGLGLTPLCLGFKPEFAEFLTPFLSGVGSPLASLVFTEPGGVANWLEDGAPGLQTTAYLDGDTWVLNGEKAWATNCAGWDFQGAELQCVVCRCTNPDIPVDAPPAARIMILMVRREDIAAAGKGAFEVLKHQQVAGWTAVSGPHVKYTNLRVPAKNLLCAPGAGATIVQMSFEMSACLVGAMGTGIQRAIFDAALAFSKSPRGGSVPIGDRQSVADLLIDIKMRTETSRYLTWKAATKLHSDLPNYDDCRELALEAKVYCSDAAVKSAVDAMNLVGVSAYDLALPFTDLLNDAMVLPIFDGGNVGIRRRALQKLFMSEGYKPWATCYE
ncbi:acyl-CoA dehydrogenase/oxidase [Leptodontidium sp. 2 PMI_412]|nr:acyl-CoA dehydrogenase/oxidase [Leptodontidium sp. 2 PMI_412]